MDAAADRPEFAPPPQRGNLRAYSLAVAAHLVLLVALTRGLHWQREAQNDAVEAELWSALPQEAAPRPPPPPPPAPPPPPPPKPLVVPVPPPPPVVRAPPEPQVNRDAQIAIEREKEKRELERERRAEDERQRRIAQERERKAEQEREHQAQLDREREQRRKELAQKKREEELAKKKELQKQQLAEAKRKEEEKKRRQQEQEARDAKRLAQLREENMKRIEGMAGTGAPNATGTAAHASGPSASWGAKVQARVRPNIAFSDDVRGNPKAEVEVRTSPDGTIVGHPRLVHSSGNKAWDDAVIRALEKTESLPRDIDGRVPSPVIIEFRPHG